VICHIGLPATLPEKPLGQLVCSEVACLEVADNSMPEDVSVSTLKNDPLALASDGDTALPRKYSALIVGGHWTVE
jgi:hypothetical protein